LLPQLRFGARKILIINPAPQLSHGDLPITYLQVCCSVNTSANPTVA